MSRGTNEHARRRARLIAGSVALTVICICTPIASAWRIETLVGQTGATTAQEIAPFDLSLLASYGGKELDGVYAVRLSALLKRPALKPVVKLLNQQFDRMTATFKAGGLGIHVEDIDQIMGPLCIEPDKKAGRFTPEVFFKVLRTTRDIDWFKLREQQGGSLYQQRDWKGERYLTLPVVDIAEKLLGRNVKDGAWNVDFGLWPVDARTLICEPESALKKRIEAKVSGKKPPMPPYAAEWEKVSRGLVAIALDNRDGRLTKRVLTDAQLKELVDANPKANALRCFEHVSYLVAGCAGDDDFRLDVQARTDRAETTAAVTRDFWSLVGTYKTACAALAASSAKDAAFLLKALDNATVRRQGMMNVTVHAEVGSGFNALLAGFAKTESQK